MAQGGWKFKLKGAVAHPRRRATVGGAALARARPTMDHQRYSRIGQRLHEEGALGWRSADLKCSICFAELSTTYLRTGCDHLLCKAHMAEENDLPHRCPACKKNLGINDLVEQEPTFFRSDDEMRDFAKRLRPEEGVKLSMYATRFHVHQKQLETVIEARKHARAMKTEGHLREYTKTLADELNVIRPEFRKLEDELGRLQETADDLNAAKMEAEAKLAQVNARFSAYARRQQLEYAQGADSSPGGAWRGGGGGEGGSAGGGGGDGGGGYYPYAQSPHVADGGQHQLSRRPGGRDTPILHDSPQHLNKRLRPAYGQDASPRGCAQQDGTATGYGSGYAHGRDAQPLGRSTSQEMGGERTERTLGRSTSQEKSGERTARHHSVDYGLLNQASAAALPMSTICQPAHFGFGGALGRGGVRLGPGAVCESPPGPSRLPGLRKLEPPALHRLGVQVHARHNPYGL
ncbi:hypothetical protein T492DRAFT_835342 [Pavlovales sp. CCMP2436]|nr:hypothetical protein T492DRAFT_835342 [Pavlovales sp. CCMP2436]